MESEARQKAQSEAFKRQSKSKPSTKSKTEEVESKPSTKSKTEEVESKPLIIKEGAKIMSLTDGKSKMSKSGFIG